MATSASSQAMWVPGRLVKGPTNLAAAFPYGGTELGLVRGLWLEPRARHFEVLGEEYGQEPVEVLQLGFSFYVGTLFRAWDNDALTALWPNSAAGSSSGDRVLSWPGTIRSGDKLSDRAFKMLFVPRDTSNHPSVLVYKAIPVIEDAPQVVHRITAEWRYPASFMALRDDTLTSDKAIFWGKIEDLSLT